MWLIEFLAGLIVGFLVLSSSSVKPNRKRKLARQSPNVCAVSKSLNELNEGLKQLGFENEKRVSAIQHVLNTMPDGAIGEQMTIALKFLGANK